MSRYTRILLAVGLLTFGMIAQADYVEIKPIQICNDAGLNCATTGFFEAETDKIWAQAGIDMSFLAVSQINNSAWLDVDIDSNPGNNILDTEAIDIIQFADANINDSDVTLAINMFFVDTLDASAGFYGLGCGAPLFAGFCVNEIGIFIAGGVFTFNGGVGRLDTIAHEIGHVLGLTHGGFGAGGGENFMTSGSGRTVPGSINDIAPDGANLSQLTAAQNTEANSSRFVQDGDAPVRVPEPSSLVLLLIGGLLLLTIGTRRAPAGAAA